MLCLKIAVASKAAARCKGEPAMPFRTLPPTARRILAAAGVFAGILNLAIYENVQSASRPIYRAAKDAPVLPVAIVFGAGLDNPVIDDRVQAGVDLYKAGKVRALLMTGDNGRAGYDEPGAMRDRALASGVPAQAIACDYAGFRTYDSLYRARAIFGVRSAVLVTQKYHLPRALYLGRHLGISVVGMDAARHSYGPAQRWFSLREVAADEAAWWDVHLHRRPKFLGPPESLPT